ncbi:hypothetical protein DL93DRAFT_2061475, partial [Clavulina sp. PMI_390]
MAELPSVPRILERALSPPLTVLSEGQQPFGPSSHHSHHHQSHHHTTHHHPHATHHPQSHHHYSQQQQQQQQHHSHNPHSILTHSPPRLLDGGPPPSKKRKKTLEQRGPPGAIPEPRRLRRLHEACARCRRKKIKCDSMMPNCGACATAGVECTQEDRHRQMLKPRAWTDQLETQVEKCVALLERLIDGFRISDVDHWLAVYGPGSGVAARPPSGSSSAPPPPPATATAGVGTPTTPGAPYPGAAPHPHEYHHPDAAHSHPQYAAGAAPTSASSSSSTRPGAGGAGPSGPGNREVIVKLEPPPPPTISSSSAANASMAAADDKGRDPNGNDMSAFAGLIRGFGVGKVYAKGVKPGDTGNPGSSSSASGSGRFSTSSSSAPTPGSGASPYTNYSAAPPSSSESSNYNFLLPRDRHLAQKVLDCYFDNLNPHRPVFMRDEFMEKVQALYDSDAGFLCSVYLVFALGTMALRNRRGKEDEDEVGPYDDPALFAALEEHWPSHEDFYDLALALKTDLANSISTLQALILLHWYLYCERHGKALWRLVGNLIRLAIELGLHHDPSEQDGTFTFKERQLRSQLWYICLVHDRGTSIMFGRPLAVQSADYKTPFPHRAVVTGGDVKRQFFSEDFDLSNGLCEIQGEIVCSLLRPGKLSGEQVIVHAINIERLLEDWRQSMPASYKRWVGASSLFREGEQDELLADVTVDGGLVMLKYLILRMWLLRTIFMNTLVKTNIRFNALRDAVITAHNVLAFHSCLVQQPDVAFFVSPIPIQMTAMIILYARFSKVEALDPEIAKADCALALKLVPTLRWRWERQDNQGSHPLIARLAHKLL